jgi:co-chaperonin GroES (HSP10)
MATTAANPYSTYEFEKRMEAERQYREFQNRHNGTAVDTANTLQRGQAGWRTEKGYHAANKSGFRATGHRVLLLPDEVEKKTASGIVFVEKTVNAEEQMAVIATVVEIGPDAWGDKSTDYCAVGDRVLVGQYVGKFHVSPKDGKKYRFVSDLDIISPIEE